MKNTKNIVIGLMLVGALVGCKKKDQQDLNPNSTRYNELVFQEVNVESNVKYGSSTTQGGVTQDLVMDIYTPSGDTQTNRPLVILAHGGGFQGGDKESMADLSTFFAQSGYVAVSLKYRVLDINPSPFIMKKAVIDATHDMRAAIRFFRKDASDQNIYNIDVNNIFAGGYSAGGFMGLHTAYLNSESEVFDIGGQPLVDYVNANGGLEGNSGNSGYSSSIKGAISLAGALAKASMINSGEPILFSFHGTADTVVPYYTGDADGSGVDTDGPGVYHPVADAQGVVNVLKTVQNGIHDCFWETDGSYIELRNFIYSNL